MNDQTKNIYNAILNKLYELGNMYHGMWIDFKAGPVPLKGFSCFVYNESMERWRLGKEIISYMIEYRDDKPTLTQLPVIVTAYNDPAAALGTAIEAEKQLVALFQNNISNAEILEHDKMTEIYNKCYYEHNEIEAVIRKMSIPGADLYGIDKYLRYKYKDCIKK